MAVRTRPFAARKVGGMGLCFHRGGSPSPASSPWACGGGGDVYPVLRVSPLISQVVLFFAAGRCRGRDSCLCFLFPASAVLMCRHGARKLALSLPGGRPADGSAVLGAGALAPCLPEQRYHGALRDGYRLVRSHDRGVLSHCVGLPRSFSPRCLAPLSFPVRDMLGSRAVEVPAVGRAELRLAFGRAADCRADRSSLPGVSVGNNSYLPLPVSPEAKGVRNRGEIVTRHRRVSDGRSWKAGKRQRRVARVIVGLTRRASDPWFSAGEGGLFQDTGRRIPEIRIGSAACATRPPPESVKYASVFGFAFPAESLKSAPPEGPGSPA